MTRLATSSKVRISTVTRPQLAFLACPSYHGATLLALALNNHPAIVAAGDTVPQRAHLDYYCSCRAQIGDCAHWRAVLARTALYRGKGNSLLPDTPRLVGDARLNWVLNSYFTRLPPTLARIA